MTTVTDADLRDVRGALYAMNDRTWYLVAADEARVDVFYSDGPARHDVIEEVRSVLGENIPVCAARTLSREVLLRAETTFQLMTGQLSRSLLDERGRLLPGAPTHVEATWVGAVYAGTPLQVLEQIADVFVLGK